MTDRLREVSGDGWDRPPRDDLVRHYPLGDGRGATRDLVGQAAHDHAHLEVKPVCRRRKRAK